MVTAARRQKHEPMILSRRFGDPVGDGGLSLGDVVADPFPGPEATAIARDELARLAQIAWSTMERRVLPYMLDGSTYQDAAAELGVGVKTIDNTFQRVRVKARAALAAA